MMNCPNCHKEMKPITQRIWDQIDWDEEEYETVGYYCDKCKIRHNENYHMRYDTPEWELPDELKPTAKQINTVDFIYNILGYSNLPYKSNLVTKKDYWEFIGKYIEKAREIIKK